MSIAVILIASASNYVLYKTAYRALVNEFKKMIILLMTITQYK